MLARTRILKTESLGLQFAMICLFCFAALSSVAQSDNNSGTTTNEQLWLDFNPHFYLTEKLEFYGDAGFRTVLDQDTWKRFYIRPSLRYHYSDYVQFRGGVGFFYIDNEGAPNSFELRPWQGVNARWPRYSQVYFEHLFRVEERMIWQIDGHDDFSFEFRMRYKLTGKILFCKPCGDQYWFLPFYGEAFYPVSNESDERFKNRTRLAVGVGYKRSRKWQYDINFVWQSSKASPTEDVNVNDNIIQLKVRRLMK